MTNPISDFFEGIEHCARQLLNPVMFGLRRAIGLNRRGYRESVADPGPLPESYRDVLDSARATDLAQRYGLETVRPNLTRATFCKTLHYCDLLDQVAERTTLLNEIPDDVHVLDIGAKNFESAPALYRFLHHLDPESPRTVHLTGIEIDGYVIYRNLHSRSDAAHYYLGLLEAPAPDRPHLYLAEDMLTHRGQYDFITWFHPFLDAYPLLKWGLPGRMLKPRQMFDHMLTLMHPGAVCLIVNQEEHENEVQTEMLRGSGRRFDSFRLHSPFFRDEQKPIYVHVLKNIEK